MQQQRVPARKMDVERLILLPPIVLLLLMNVTGAYDHFTSLERWGLGSTLDAVYRALIVVFYLMIVVLLLVRAPSKAGTSSIAANGAAYLGTFAPFLLVLQGETEPPGTGVALASITLMVLGIGFSVYAVTYLGRSFGATPNARRLVTSGPYSLVRHPLYVGEAVALAGLVLGRLSAFSVAVLVVTLTVQCYRVLQEEAVLAAAFPEYASYRVRTRRFIPGVV